MGFSVADIPQTIEHCGQVWVDVIEGKCDIKAVVDSYEKVGYNASCDVPANAFWKELYEAIDGCKELTDHFFNNISSNSQR